MEGMIDWTATDQQPQGGKKLYRPDNTGRMYRQTVDTFLRHISGTYGKFSAATPELSELLLDPDTSFYEFMESADRSHYAHPAYLDGLRNRFRRQRAACPEQGDRSRISEQLSSAEALRDCLRAYGRRPRRMDGADRTVLSLLIEAAPPRWPVNGSSSSWQHADLWYGTLFIRYRELDRRAEISRTLPLLQAIRIGQKCQRPRALPGPSTPGRRCAPPCASYGSVFLIPGSGRMKSTGTAVWWRRSVRR